MKAKDGKSSPFKYDQHWNIHSIYDGNKYKIICTFEINNDKVVNMISVSIQKWQHTLVKFALSSIRRMKYKTLK